MSYVRTLSGSVVTGYCFSPRTYEAAFAESLIDVFTYTAAHNPQSWFGRIPMQSSANVSAARNAIVERFLTSSAEWLWMLDTDMVFEPNTLERLLASADRSTAPIVGGLCFGLDEAGELYPTLYEVTPGEQTPVARYTEWPADEPMMRVAATGAACLLIHRTVLEEVRDLAGAGRWSTAYPWFQEREYDLGSGPYRIGEDITFCLRAAVAGFPVHVNTSIEIGHVKGRVLTAAAYREQRERGADR